MRYARSTEWCFPAHSASNILIQSSHIGFISSTHQIDSLRQELMNFQDFSSKLSLNMFHEYRCYLFYFFTRNFQSYFIISLICTVDINNFGAMSNRISACLSIKHDLFINLLPLKKCIKIKYVIIIVFAFVLIFLKQLNPII
jgi:hypothetical protein